MDLDQISSEQKAAAIVIALGVDKASSIYKYLDDTDIEKLTVEIAKLGYFSSEITEAILDEFYKTCMTQKVVTEGGIEYARSVLEKAFGEDAAANLLGKVEKNLKTRAFSFLAKSDNKTIFTLLHNERPQTIALVLSYLDSDRAANIISELDESKRLSVVEAIARMDGAAPESMKIIERELQKKMSSVMTTDYAKIGGIDYIADVMNYVDRSNEKFIFDELGKKDAELVDEIRKKMFVFEDIVGMDRLSVQRFLRDVDQKTLVYSLKGASKELAEVFFTNMSNRMAEATRSELEITTNVRVKDVEEAQQSIVALIRKLEEIGQLVITKAGKGDIIA